MLHLTADSNILLAIEPVDFRKQIDGLASLCELHLKQEPRSGALFVFINRTKTMIRILCYQDNGFWLSTKRLSRGRYLYWPKGDGSTYPLHAAKLTQILKGVLASS